MPLNARNTRTLHRRLYGGQLKRVTLLKRDDDQREGTVRAIVLHQCRRSIVQKSGEPIQADMSVAHRTVWHVPVSELKRVGVSHLNVLDRIVETHDDGKRPLAFPQYWQPESGDTIMVKLFENYYTVQCVRIDPPRTA